MMVPLIVLILLLGLSPALATAWVMRQTSAQSQVRLQQALGAIAQTSLPTLQPTPDLRYIEGIGLLIGDFTCRYNARSRYLRCAINPAESCKTCRYYSPIE